MRTRSELRLECLRLAVALATCKAIGSSKVTDQARAFVEFIDDDVVERDQRQLDLNHHPI